MWGQGVSSGLPGLTSSKELFCTMCVTCLSSLCDWFSLSNIIGARPERSGRFGLRPKKGNIEPCSLTALYCVLRESLTFDGSGGITLLRVETRPNYSRREVVNANDALREDIFNRDKKG